MEGWRSGDYYFLAESEKSDDGYSIALTTLADGHVITVSFYFDDNLAINMPLVDEVLDTFTIIDER